jgi:hypothetical protein
MASPVTRLLAAEHAESRAKLMACHLCNGEVDLRRFDDFRQALPRHIAIEEKVLMPALTKVLGKAPLFQNGLRMDHAGIAALCIPTPTSEWLDDLKELLEHHQRVEEAPPEASTRWSTGVCTSSRPSRRFPNSSCRASCAHGSKTCWRSPASPAGPAPAGPAAEAATASNEGLTFDAAVERAVCLAGHGGLRKSHCAGLPRLRQPVAPRRAKAAALLAVRAAPTTGLLLREPWARWRRCPWRWQRPKRARRRAACPRR